MTRSVLPDRSGDCGSSNFERRISAVPYINTDARTMTGMMAIISILWRNSNCLIAFVPISEAVMNMISGGQ